LAGKYNDNQQKTNYKKIDKKKNQQFREINNYSDTQILKVSLNKTTTIKAKII